MAWRIGAVLALALAGAAGAQERAGVCPAEASCSVLASSPLGEGVGWALHEVRTPTETYGLSVISAPQGRAAMRAPGQAVARWRKTPYSAAGLVKHGGAEYAATAMKVDDGVILLDVYRVDPAGLTRMDAQAIPAEVRAKATGLTKAGCAISTTHFDWRTFRVRYGLISDEGSCGSVLIDLAVENDRVKIADAIAFR